MLKCAIVFCVIGTAPCTRDNSIHTVEVGKYRFPHQAQLANMKQGATLNKARGNGEYFTIVCVPE